MIRYVVLLAEKPRLRNHSNEIGHTRNRGGSVAKAARRHSVTNASRAFEEDSKERSRRWQTETLEIRDPAAPLAAPRCSAATKARTVMPARKMEGFVNLHGRLANRHPHRNVRYRSFGTSHKAPIYKLRKNKLRSFFFCYSL